MTGKTYRLLYDTETDEPVWTTVGFDKQTIWVKIDRDGRTVQITLDDGDLNITAFRADDTQVNAYSFKAPDEPA